MVGALIQVALALYLATVLALKVKGGSFFKAFSAEAGGARPGKAVK